MYYNTKQTKLQYVFAVCAKKSGISRNTWLRCRKQIHVKEEKEKSAEITPCGLALPHDNSPAAKPMLGAGSRGRTDTVLLPSDFESDASANSTIPANGADLSQRYVL